MHYAFKSNNSFVLLRYSFLFKMFYQLIYLVTLSTGKVELPESDIVFTSFIFILSAVFDVGNAQSVIGEYKPMLTFGHIKTLLVLSICLLPLTLLRLPVFVAPLLASSGIIRNIYIVGDKTRAIAILDLGSFIISVIGLFVMTSLNLSLLWVVFLPVLSETIILLGLYKRLINKVKFRISRRYAYWYNNAQDVIINQLDILIVSKFFNVGISQQYFLLREWYKRFAQAINLVYLRLLYHYKIQLKLYLFVGIISIIGLVYFFYYYAIIGLVIFDVYLVYGLIRSQKIALLNRLQFSRFIIFVFMLMILSPMNALFLSEILFLLITYIFYY